MYKQFFILVSSLLTLQVNGQASAPDAFGSIISMAESVNTPTLMGTSRFVGSGGVLGSVGADISTLSTNPAGLGMFSRSEFEITPNLQINNVNANYQYFTGSGSQSSVIDKNQPVFNLGSIGIVFATRNGEGQTLRSSNVTIGLNRTANFNRQIDFGVGNNSAYSYSNYLADLATDLTGRGLYVPFGSRPILQDYALFDNIYNRTLIAHEAELIGTSNTTGVYADPIPRNSSGRVTQFGSRKIRGGIDELSVAWSGSIKDKGYVGVSLGIPFLKYHSEFSISEDNIGSTITNPYGKFNYFDLKENDNYNGTGINLKLGGLYKINDQLKVSGYFHSPTLYKVTNTYTVSMVANYQLSNNPNSRTLSEYEFDMITPFKVGGGFSYLFGKKGFIGAEYEYSNLVNGSIDIKDVSANNYINSALSGEQANTHTLRVGGEFVVDVLRFRAGYNYRTSPLQSAYHVQGGNQIQQTLCFGAGIRGPEFSFDFAFQRQYYADYNPVYDNTSSTFGIASWNSQNNMMATLNYRFNSGNR
jgi:hypothetical protein